MIREQNTRLATTRDTGSRPGNPVRVRVTRLRRMFPSVLHGSGAMGLQGCRFAATVAANIQYKGAWEQ